MPRSPPPSVREIALDVQIDNAALAIANRLFPSDFEVADDAPMSTIALPDRNP